MPEETIHDQAIKVRTARTQLSHVNRYDWDDTDRLTPAPWYTDLLLALDNAPLVATDEAHPYLRR
jgi:hypothetical protein